METMGLPPLLSTSEETEEPSPKKLKIDRSHIGSEDEQQQLLQNLYYADKKSAHTSLHFPEVLWNFSQNGLKLQEEKSADSNNVRQFAHFKQFTNANLQSRLLGNVPHYETLTLDSNNCSIIRGDSSEFNENNQLVTKSESWALHAKGNRSFDSGIILKESELPIVNTIIYKIMVENLIKIIESLFKNVPEFQRNGNGKGCHCARETFRSEEQYHIPEPVMADKNITDKTSHQHRLTSHLMKERKSELGCLFYENKNITDEDDAFLSWKKCARFPATQKHPRKVKASQCIYMPFSRIGSIRNPKLVSAAFELFLQDKILYDSSITSKQNETSVFSQGLLFNIKQRGVSKERRINECPIFSKNTVEDYIVLESGTEKDRISKQFVFSSSQVSPKNIVLNSTLWEKQLCNPKNLQEMRGNFKFLNYLSSGKNIFKKLSIKYSSSQIVVTVGTCLKEKKIRNFSKNNAFSIKKQQSSHFILRASKKHRIRTSRNNINIVSKSKYVFKYLRTCGRAMRNKNEYRNRKDSCGFIDTEARFSSFDTHKKIYLNTDSEEVFLISFFKNVNLNDNNNEKCMKGCTLADTRITYSALDTLNSCLPHVLIANVTNSNCFLVQDTKKKKFLDYININSQWSKYEINDTSFPINYLKSGNKYFSDDDKYFTSTITHCKDQNLADCVKAWDSKIVLLENSGKQSGFIFGNIKDVLFQPTCHSRDSKYLKHRKIKKVRDNNFLLQKYMFSGSMHSSELESMKQKAIDVNKIENEVVQQSYTSKSYQSVIVAYSKDESAKFIESKDNVMVISCTQKEQHSEHKVKEHSSTRLKDRYEFEMKNQFDLVLEELCMFNEIDNKNGTRLLCGKRNVLQDLLEQNRSDSIPDEDDRNVCENMTFSTCSTTLKFITTETQKENGESLFEDTTVKQIEKQEVLHDSSSSSISDKEFHSLSEEHCDSGCKQLFRWKPAFVYHTLTKKETYSFQNEKGNCLLDGMIRVQPLKTCHGPLRIGLSRKAKLKQLHPYLK